MDKLDAVTEPMRITRDGMAFIVHPDDVAAVRAGDPPPYVRLETDGWKLDGAKNIRAAVMVVRDGTIYIGNAVCDLVTP